MSVSIVCERGPVKQVASVQGWENLLIFVAKQGPSDLLTFIEDGAAYSPEEIASVLKTIDRLLPAATDVHIKSTLEGLKEALENTKEWAGVSG